MSNSETIITFRLPSGAVDKLNELAVEVPRIEGEPSLSRHQMARSIILEALEGKERNTRNSIMKGVVKILETFNPKVRSQKPTDDAFNKGVDLFVSSMKREIDRPLSDDEMKEFSTKMNEVFQEYQLAKAQEVWICKECQATNSPLE